MTHTLEVTQSTTVQHIEEEIKVLEAAKKKAADNSDMSATKVLQQLISNYSSTKDTIINYCRNDIIKHDLLSHKNGYVKTTATNWQNNGYKQASIETLNYILNAAGITTESHKVPTTHGAAYVGFGQYKQGGGFGLTTAFKALVAGCAILSSWTFNFGALGTGGAVATLTPLAKGMVSAISGLFASGSLGLGILALGAAGFGVGVLFKKVFGKELRVAKKTVAAHKAANKYIDQARATSNNATLSYKAALNNPPQTMAGVIDFIKKHNSINNEQAILSDLNLAGVNFKTLVSQELDLFDNEKNRKTIEQYKKYLNPQQIHKLRNEFNITEKKDFSDTYNNVKNSQDLQSSDDAKNAYNNFKKDYNSIVRKIVKNTPQEHNKIIKEIRTLDNFAKDDSNFNMANKDDSKKLQGLCQSMVEMLKDLEREVVQNKTTYKDANEAKKQIAAQHGLDSNDLENLLK